MTYRQIICLLFALAMANAVAAQAIPGSGTNAGKHQVGSDLTGFWQQDEGQIFHFTQEGSSLTARHLAGTANSKDNEIDFTATIYDNLVYGAHRASLSRVIQEKCSNQIWVGMGLTLNDERTALKGFRGVRIVDPKNCSVKDSDPVGLVYTRIADPDPLE